MKENNKIEGLNFNGFVNSYLHTAIWVTIESGECSDFTKEAKKCAEIDCQKFIDLVVDKFGFEKATELLTINGTDLEYLTPHDFFLTRNGHGTGFWDKENIYGESEAHILTEISKEMKESDCYHIAGKKSKLTFA